METKLVKVPFDVEMAKKIINKEVEGKIVTRDGKSVRVICLDKKNVDKSYSILALIDNDKEEVIQSYNNNGLYTYFECKQDLMLEIPEYLTFKEGDVLKFSNRYCFWISIIKDIELEDGEYSTDDYAVLMLGGEYICDEFELDTFSDDITSVEKPTEEEKQRLIEALKASEEPKAKEYLKRFFGIEHSNSSKIEKELKPFDKVLVRDSNEEAWHADFFSHKKDDLYVCIGETWEQCISYEGNEHLLGKIS